MIKETLPLKKTIRIALLAGSFAMAIACANPSGLPSPSVTPGLDLSKPSAVLKAVTVGTVDLPASLQDGSTNAGARSLSGHSRALGDVSTLTSLNLPSLKAEGYIDFKNEIGQSSIAKIFLDALKTSQAVVNDSLALDTVTDMGTIDLNMASTVIALPNSGKLRASLSSDGATLFLFWKLNYPDPTKYDPSSGQTMQDFFNSGARIVIPVYMTVNTSGALQMYASSSTMALKCWSKYDPSTKESIQAQNSMGNSFLNLVQPQSNGGFYIYSTTASSTFASETMGYADDNYGGVVMSGMSTWTDSSGNTTTEPYLSVEYYDGTGNLIYRGWGDSSQNMGQWSWLANMVGSACNLATLQTAKPETFLVKESYNWDSSNSTSSYATELSFDGGVSWTSLPSQYWQFAYHTPNAGDTTSTWAVQSGDAVYYPSQNSYSTTQSGSMSTWINLSTYYKAVEVPASETYFGQQYFVRKNYPLKNLLPLTGQYAAGFEVKQKEGTTYYSWKDSSGVWQSDTAMPSTYTPGTLNSWTSYDYWLENTAYVDPTADHSKPNDPNTIDPELGDVHFDNVQPMQVWYWNSATQTSVSAMSPAYMSTLVTLPPYFQTNQAGNAAAAAVKAKLEAFYASRSTQTVASYLADFDTVMNGVSTQFPN